MAARGANWEEDFTMHVRQFRYLCKKCNRTITVPGRVGVCPVCGTRLEDTPKQVEKERAAEPMKWESDLRRERQEQEKKKP